MICADPSVEAADAAERCRAGGLVGGRHTGVEIDIGCRRIDDREHVVPGVVRDGQPGAHTIAAATRRRLALAEGKVCLLRWRASLGCGANALRAFSYTSSTCIANSNGLARIALIGLRSSNGAIGDAWTLGAQLTFFRDGPLTKI
jgi:hypothetical protein